MAKTKEGKNRKGEATANSNNSNYEGRGKCWKEDQGRANIVSGTFHKIQG
jgi:hypothetical protein